MTDSEFANYHLKKSLKTKFDKIQYCYKKAEYSCNQLMDGFTWERFDREFLGTPSVSNTHDIFELIKNKADAFEKEGKLKSRDTFLTTLNHLQKFTARKKMSVYQLNTDFLKKFEKYLSSDGLSLSSIGLYMRNIRTAYNSNPELEKRKNTDPDSYPFGEKKYNPPTTRKAKKALKLIDIKAIYDYKSDNEREMMSRDMWLFSYFANGLNMKDIVLLKYGNIKEDGFIHVIREKTRDNGEAEKIVIKIPVTEDLKRIISKWGNKGKKPGDFLFPFLSLSHTDAETVYKTVNQAIKTENKYMKRIAMALGLDRIPTTNFARHSYATVLKNAGVPVSMISEQLGHAKISTTQIYLSGFEDGQLMDASKFLTAFKEVKK